MTVKSEAQEVHSLINESVKDNFTNPHTGEFNPATSRLSPDMKVPAVEFPSTSAAGDAQQAMNAVNAAHKESGLEDYMSAPARSARNAEYSGIVQGGVEPTELRKEINRTRP